MDEALLNRLDALEIAMRLVAGEMASHAALFSAWDPACDAFILSLPPDQAHRGPAIRATVRLLHGQQLP